MVCAAHKCSWYSLVDPFWTAASFGGRALGRGVVDPRNGTAVLKGFVYESHGGGRYGVGVDICGWLRGGYQKHPIGCRNKQEKAL